MFFFTLTGLFEMRLTSPPHVCSALVFLFSSGVCAATSAVGTSRLSRSPSLSGPEAPKRTERAAAAWTAPRLFQRRRVAPRPHPHPAKWTKRKRREKSRVDVSAFSEPLTDEFTESESKPFGYVSNSHSRYRIRLSADFLHLKTYFQGVAYSCFPPCQTARTVFSANCKVTVRKRVRAAGMSVFGQRGRREKKEKSLRSFSFPNDVHTETMGRRSD